MGLWPSRRLVTGPGRSVCGGAVSRVWLLANLDLGRALIASGRSDRLRCEQVFGLAVLAGIGEQGWPRLGFGDRRGRRIRRETRE
jgi:hypothetical protein